MLDLFTRYECLPTTYIHKAIGEQYAKDLITLLNTEGYIRIPVASTKRMDARNKEAMWEGTPKGEKLLGKTFRKEGDHFQHKAHRTVAWFLFDHAARALGLERRTITDIVLDERCPLATRAEQRPSTFDIDGYTVIPDEELSGFRLTLPNGKHRSFYFFLEADGGTETRVPGTEKAHKKKSTQTMIEMYAAFFAREMYQSRYGLKNIIVFIIVKDWTDALSIMRVIGTVAPKHKRRFAFKVIPDFTEGFPKPDETILTEDWHTLEGPLNILNILKGGDANGRSETGPNSAVEKAA